MPARRRHLPDAATNRRLPALPGPRGGLGPALPVPILRMGRVLWWLTRPARQGTLRRNRPSRRHLAPAPAPEMVLRPPAHHL